MCVFKFIEKEDEEEEDNDFVNDNSDIQEKEIKQYDEHFWCKSKDVPVGFTFKSKKQDFIRASDNIKLNFQNSAKGSLKQMDNVAFRIMDCRKRDSGPEMDIELIKNKDRGVAVLKFYGPNSKTGECTIMINKSKRHDVKFVKILAEEVIKYLVDTFISGEGWGSIFRKINVQDIKQFSCIQCKKVFTSEKNLNTHKEKYHKKETYSCDPCGYKAKDQADLNDHIENHTVRESNRCDIRINDDISVLHRMSKHTSKEKICKDKKELEEHKGDHTKKEYICGNCDFATESRCKIKEHIEGTHREKREEEKLLIEEPEDMEIEEIDDVMKVVSEMDNIQEERKKRSEMQDKKVIETQRKRDLEEQRVKLEKQESEKKKAEAEKERQEEEKMKRKKRKASIKQQKKKIKRKLNKYPLNVTEVPENVKHLVGEGDLQLLVPPDGACGPNSGAAHLFKDPRFGPNFRIQMNNFMADRWHYYQDKISFPYKRKIGVNGDFVRFEIGEEEKFRQFLRTKRAAFLWTDSEDLQVMANMYQMQIKVITTKGPEDSHATVNMIGPDPELNNFKLLPEGKVSDMTLLHYDELHYNLVISKDDHIAKFGTLSQYLTIEETERLVDEGFKDTENEAVEESTLAEAYKKSKETIEKQNKRIKLLEKEIQEKSNELQEAIETIEHAHEFKTIKSKKNEENAKFNCTKCNSKFKNQVLLENHIKLGHTYEKEFNCLECNFKGRSGNDLRNHLSSIHHKPDQNLLKELKECQASKKNVEDEYSKCEQELRIKTGEYERLKIEVQDLRTIVDLRKQLDEKESTRSNRDKQYGKVKTNNVSELDTKEEMPLLCAQSENKGNRQDKYEKHNSIKHSVEELEISETDEEFNCIECDFQTTSTEYLRKHIKIKHRIICKICEKEFKEKSNLMLHRKTEHYNSVATCRKFADKNCPFVEETCWWRHTEKERPMEDIRCFVCGNTFQGKNELMKHRKKEHAHIVKDCEKFKDGKCGFQNDYCWYIHAMKKNQIDKKVENIVLDEMDIDNEEEQSKLGNSVFHEAQKKAKPPLEEKDLN